jgi:hypothetical protein
VVRIVRAASGHGTVAQHLVISSGARQITEARIHPGCRRAAKAYLLEVGTARDRRRCQCDVAQAAPGRGPAASRKRIDDPLSPIETAGHDLTSGAPMTHLPLDEHVHAHL